MMVLIAAETIAAWSLASLGAALAGAVPVWAWRHRRRDRQAVRERLFRLCR